ncbi:OmpA family protein [candidate division KSB1 bacterium]|nr:OmpA family protein [candidate division KSB1 bacterium]
MAARKKRKKAEDSAPDMGWLMTYGDLMTLLVTFFVLLLTFSSIQMNEFKKAMGSLQGALGVLDADRGEKLISKDLNNYDAMTMMESDFEVFFDEAEMANLARVEQTTSSGLRIILDNSILFEPGHATLKPTVFPVLQRIGEIIKRASKMKVMVEGHTDNIPIHNAQFDSNWELSAMRAISVVKFFIDNLAIDPKRIQAAGKGEYAPIVPNNSPENRAKNRRVEILIDLGDKFLW